MYYGLPQRGQRRMDFMAWSLVGVGVFSGVYHATLLQYAQCGDDLSMLVFTGAMVQAVYAAGAPKKTARLMTTALTASIAFVSAAYLVTLNTALHRTMFTLLLVVVGPRVHRLIWDQRRRTRDASRRMSMRVLRAFAIALTGFALWNVEMVYCHELRGLKERLGLPWSWLFELHGWWHILTAFGAGQLLKVIRQLRDEREADAEVTKTD